jgi:DNA-directed RNA polymerase subunit RPC12/RpoP
MDWNSCKEFTFGECPDCGVKLNPGNCLTSEKSKVFKGGNYYLVCDNCGLTVLYNKPRAAIMNLDKYNEDPKVLEELNLFFNHAGLEFSAQSKSDIAEEVIEEASCEDCNYNCFMKNNQQEEDVIDFDDAEPIPKEALAYEPIDLSHKILCISKSDGSTTILEKNQFKDLTEQFLVDFEFYELEKILIERVVTYNFIKVE